MTENRLVVNEDWGEGEGRDCKGHEETLPVDMFIISAMMIVLCVYVQTYQIVHFKRTVYVGYLNKDTFFKRHREVEDKWVEKIYRAKNK